jgi:EpsI family protein
VTGDRVRFIAVVLLLITTIGFLQLRGTPEKPPHSQPLALLPMEISGWQGVERPLSNDVREILGAGDFLDRLYSRSDQRASVDLLIAYFPSQRTGSTIHSPKHCLPGAGWDFISSNRTQLRLPGTKPQQVNEVVLGKGADKLMAIYWYQAHGRVVASEYQAKYYLIADAIRMNRTDGSLVRLITPMAPGETAEDAHERLVTLISPLAPMLKDYIPE